MNIDLTGKVFLVTGGTGVIGSCLVKRLLEEKASVYFTYFRNEALAQELSSRGAKPLQSDLSRSEDIERLKETFKKTETRLDGLINNAGIVRDRTVGNLTEEEFDEVLNVDLKAVFQMTKKFLPLLYKSENAKVINITSRVGMQGGFGEANYAAAKAGVVAFTKTLAAEVGRKGICVNAVAPGFILSGMTADLPEEVYEKQKRESYLGVLGDPEELSDFLIYLLSNHIKGVTGQLFYFDSRRTKIF